MDKYDYFIREDFISGVIEQAKCEYSRLGKVFNKGLEKEDKKEGLLKRFKKKNEGKNEEQLKAIKDQGEEQLKLIKDHGEKQLKLLESDANNANAMAFQSIKLMNRLNAKTKNGLMK